MSNVNFFKSFAFLGFFIGVMQAVDNLPPVSLKIINNTNQFIQVEQGENKITINPKNSYLPNYITFPRISFDKIEHNLFLQHNPFAFHYYDENAKTSTGIFLDDFRLRIKLHEIAQAIQYTIITNFDYNQTNFEQGSYTFKIDKKELVKEIQIIITFDGDNFEDSEIDAHLIY